MKRLLCIMLSIIMLCSVCGGFMTSAASDYKIISPYEDVVWSGDNAWGAYRGVLHSHTTWSDADEDLPAMVKEYYSEITNKKGKIVTSSIKTGIRLGAGESMKRPSVSTNTDLEYMPAGHDAGAELNDTQTDFTQVLVQKLLELPKEDLSFLSKDIPDEIWNTLIQYK